MITTSTPLKNNPKNKNWLNDNNINTPQKQSNNKQKQKKPNKPNKPNPQKRFLKSPISPRKLSTHNHSIHQKTKSLNWPISVFQNSQPSLAKPFKLISLVFQNSQHSIHQNIRLSPQNGIPVFQNSQRLIHQNIKLSSKMGCLSSKTPNTQSIKP